MMRVSILSTIGLATVCLFLPVAEGEDSKERDETLRFPRVVIEVDDQGSLRRNVRSVECPDIGFVWAKLLKEPSICQQLEVLNDQQRELLRAAKVADGDPRKYRVEVEAILLPHQLDELRSLIVRYQCIASGVLIQLADAEFFADFPLAVSELEAIQAKLQDLANRHLESSTNELRKLDQEVRRSLTRKQLDAIEQLIGDRMVLEGPFLDVAILRLETTADLRKHRLDVKMSDAAAILGRSTKYELAFTGELQPTRSDTPMHFFAAFRNGIQRAGLVLEPVQRDLLFNFEKDLVAAVSGESKRVYRLLTLGELSEEEAKDILRTIADREINRTVTAFDTMLTLAQQQQLDRYVLRRDLAQRSLLPVLIEGYWISITDQQKGELLDLAKKRLEHFRELMRDLEAEIWNAVRYGLAPQHRDLWDKSYGDGTLKCLPVTPVLLLYRGRGAPPE